HTGKCFHAADRRLVRRGGGRLRALISPQEPIDRLAEERHRVLEAERAEAVAGAPEKEVEERGPARRRAVGERELLGRAPEAGDRVVDVAPAPAEAVPGAIDRWRAGRRARRGADEERREVDAGVDGELERAPETRVHLHEVREAGPGVDLSTMATPDQPNRSRSAPAEPTRPQGGATLSQ